MVKIDEIVWTDSAKEDLKNIFDFISDNINENVALIIVEDLINKVEILYSQPFAGQKEPKFEKLEREYRRLVAKHCKLVYHIREDKAYINRVFDTRQNPNKLNIK